MLRTLNSHLSGAVNSVRFSGDGNYCMTAGDDRIIMLWNPHKEDPSKLGSALHIKSYSGVHGYSVLDVAIASDNSKFASAGGDKSAFYWDISTGRVIRRIQAHAHRINSIAMNEDSSVLFTASYDKTVCAWDLRSNSREPIQTMKDFTDSVTSVITTQSSIIAACVDGNLRTYDIRSSLSNIDNLKDPITCVRLTNDKKCALCTCIGGTIRLVSLASGQVLQEYKGSHTHESFKLESCISSDDCHVVTCSEDGYFVDYDLVPGTLSSRTLSTSENPFNTQKQSVSNHLSTALSSLSYHPTKPLLLTASYNGCVKIWDCSATKGLK